MMVDVSHRTVRLLAHNRVWFIGFEGEPAEIKAQYGSYVVLHVPAHHYRKARGVQAVAASRYMLAVFTPRVPAVNENSSLMILRDEAPGLSWRRCRERLAGEAKRLNEAVQEAESKHPTRPARKPRKKP